MIEYAVELDRAARPTNQPICGQGYAEYRTRKRASWAERNRLERGASTLITL